MLTCLHTIVKIGGFEEARRYKNMDHMIVDHDIATVRELMFCTWPQIRMEFKEVVNNPWNNFIPLFLRLCLYFVESNKKHFFSWFIILTACNL